MREKLPGNKCKAASRSLKGRMAQAACGRNAVPAPPPEEDLASSSPRRVKARTSLSSARCSFFTSISRENICREDAMWDREWLVGQKSYDPLSPTYPIAPTFCSICVLLLVCCCARSFQVAASREAASAASAAASTSPLATSSMACTYEDRTAQKVWTVWNCGPRCLHQPPSQVLHSLHMCMCGAVCEEWPWSTIQRPCYAHERRNLPFEWEGRSCLETGPTK